MFVAFRCWTTDVYRNKEILKVKNNSTIVVSVNQEKGKKD